MFSIKSTINWIAIWKKKLTPITLHIKINSTVEGLAQYFKTSVMPMSHIRVPEFIPALASDAAFYEFRNQEAAVMARVIGSLPPVWKFWIELPAPSFSPTQFSCYGNRGNEQKNRSTLFAS